MHGFVIKDEEVIVELYRAAPRHFRIYRHRETDIAVTKYAPVSHADQWMALWKLNLMVRATREPCITKLPLKSPYDFGPWCNCQFYKAINFHKDVKAYLRDGLLAIIIIEGGYPPDIYIEKDIFKVWKLDIRSHLAHGKDEYDQSDFPDSYYYTASVWQHPEGNLLVFQKHH